MPRRLLPLLLPWLAAGCGSAPLDEDTVPALEGENDWGKADGASAQRRAAWVLQTIHGQIDGLPVEIRRERNLAMAEDAFAFFRGTALLFWADLGRDARLARFGGTGAVTWLQGDMHPVNFGSFDDDEGRIVYGLNDFDEAVVGDYQMDLWRLAAGTALMAREAGGDAATRAAEAVDAAARAYLAGLEAYRGNDDEEQAVWTKDSADGLLAGFLAKVAKKRSRADLLDEWTTLVGGRRTLDPGNPDLAPVDAATAKAMAAALPAYGATLSGGLAWSPSYFAVKGVARRLHAGTGSLGADRYYVLIESATTSQDDDRILDVKAQAAPSPWAFLDADLRDRLAPLGHARRAVLGQRALGVDVDDHLGWLTLGGQGFSVRERSPWKDDLGPGDVDDGDALVELAGAWGAVLAASHARGDEDFDASLVSSSIEKDVHERVAGEETAFRKLVVDVGRAYAAQARRDWQSFKAALDEDGDLE